MNGAPHPAAWIPPFIVGLAAAVAAELAAGLLLYATPGFLRSLTLVLGVQLGSLALGLWTVPAARDEALTESLRRRWLLALVAFAGGSGVSAAWSLRQGLAGDALSRGLGLALLAGLPLYACGALLGAMSAPRRTWSRHALVGAPAVAGAALGAILAGYVLVAALLPVSIYAFCLVLLSGGALLHGWILAAEGERRLVARAWSAYGEVTVEEWTWGKAAHRERILRENGTVRGAEDQDGRPARAWERAALDLLGHRAASGGVTEPSRGSDPSTPFAPVLVLGVGTFTLPRGLLETGGVRAVDVLERNRTVVEMAAKHFAAPLEDSGLRVLPDETLFPVGLPGGPYDAIVVDAAALALRDPVPLPGPGALGDLGARLGEGGCLLVGGLERQAAVGLPLDGFLAQAASSFPAVAVYGRAPGRRKPTGLCAASDELLLVLSPDAAADFPQAADGMVLESLHRAEHGAAAAAAHEQAPLDEGRVACE